MIEVIVINFILATHFKVDLPSVQAFDHLTCASPKNFGTVLKYAPRACC